MKKPACFSTTIDVSLADKLKHDLAEQGFAFETRPHAIFFAKKKNITCVLYESGSLVVQGKEKDPFIEFYLEPEILNSFSYSYPHINVDYTPRIGVDEAGKGDYFGPLCVAGIYLDKAGIEKVLQLGVTDSKKLADKKVLSLNIELKKFPHSIISLFPEKYNELYAKFMNLNWLLGWAHATVIENLHDKTGCQKALIDQFASQSVVENALMRKKLSLNLHQMHKAESDPVVAAASILARAAFLEGLEKLSEQSSYKLPKGASDLVVKMGEKIKDQKGMDFLDRLTKKHFKTRQIILG